MKKRIKIVAVMCALGAAACVAVTNYAANRESEDGMLLANVEALSEEEGQPSVPPELFYKITKYSIFSLLEITNVSGNLASKVSIGTLISSAKLTELQVGVSGNVTFNTIDFHQRVCLSTTEGQSIDCIPQTEPVRCHSQCNHSQNQI